MSTLVREINISLVCTPRDDFDNQELSDRTSESYIIYDKKELVNTLAQTIERYVNIAVPDGYFVSVCTEWKDITKKYN